MRGRIIQLYLGLILYGVSDSLMVLARLGLEPWDVFHQGLAKHAGLAIGTWSILVGIVVLVLWTPLQQRPGIGTVSNVVLVGGTMDIVLGQLSPPHGLTVRIVLLVVGVFLNGVATGAYIGAGLGPGPRDGLMTGFAARGHSIRIVRTGLEAIVLAIGWLLGGTVGLGTLLYAVAIGPLAHVFVLHGGQLGSDEVTTLEDAAIHVLLSQLAEDAVRILGHSCRSEPRDVVGRRLDMIFDDIVERRARRNHAVANFLRNADLSSAFRAEMRARVLSQLLTSPAS